MIGVIETGCEHTLKCHPRPFQAMVDGLKTFEFRKDDRVPSYEVGDRLFIDEWDPDLFDGEGEGGWTERTLVKLVTYVLRGPDYGVPDGYCVMAIADPEGEQGANVDDAESSRQK